jgi:Ca-activated chloride channel family protein
MSAAFDRPFLLVLGLVIIIFLIIFPRYFRYLFFFFFPLGPPGGASFKAPLNLNFGVRILKVMEILGAVLLIVAAAGPHFTYTETLLTQRGADIFFVVDASPSMAALDMNGRSRFNVSRELVKDFALARPSDALGLVAVGEDAALLVPLTTDRESFFTRLDELVIGELGDASALGMGLGIAALHIGRSVAPRRVVVLITDGENNAGAIHPETAAAVLGSMGVSLWVIGVGSGGEVPIDYIDPFTRIRRTGTYDSRYDTESLRNIAAKANGTWIPAISADAFSSAFAQLDQTEMTVRRTGVILRKEAFHGFFIIAAFLLILGPRVIRINIVGAFL